MARASSFDPLLFRLWSLLRDCARGVRQVAVLSSERARLRPDEAMHVHAVPTIEAALAGVVRIELGAREVIDLHPGEVLIVGAGVWHRHADLRAGSVSFHQGFLRQVSDLRIVSREASWQATIPLQPSRALADRLLTARSPEQRRALAAELLGLFETQRPTEVPPPHPAVERMWKFMRQNRHLPIRAADVVRSSGVGPSRAHALFLREFGETPKQALLRDRLLLARAVLAAGGSIAEAATRCGFSGSADLSRAFRRRYRLSPRAWIAAGAPNKDSGS
jgi:AraC-like DNA-binding protein